VHKLRPNEAGLEALLLVLVFVERAKLHFLQDTLVSLVKRRVQEIGSPKFFATGTLLFVRKIRSLPLFHSLPPETVLHVGTPQFLPPPFSCTNDPTDESIFPEFKKILMPDGDVKIPFIERILSIRALHVSQEENAAVDVIDSLEGGAFRKCRKPEQRKVR